jgi:hypothetical protein
MLFLLPLSSAVITIPTDGTGSGGSNPTPNLQEVTDEGSTTTNSITANKTRLTGKGVDLLMSASDDMQFNNYGIDQGFEWSYNNGLGQDIIMTLDPITSTLDIFGNEVCDDSNNCGYVTAETDTLQSVTDRGYITNNPIKHADAGGNGFEMTTITAGDGRTYGLLRGNSTNGTNQVGFMSGGLYLYPNAGVTDPVLFWTNSDLSKNLFFGWKHNQANEELAISTSGTFSGTPYMSTDLDILMKGLSGNYKKLQWAASYDNTFIKYGELRVDLGNNDFILESGGGFLPVDLKLLANDNVILNGTNGITLESDTIAEQDLQVDGILNVGQGTNTDATKNFYVQMPESSFGYDAEIWFESYLNPTSFISYPIINGNANFFGTPFNIGLGVKDEWYIHDTGGGTAGIVMTSGTDQSFMGVDFTGAVPKYIIPKLLEVQEASSNLATFQLEGDSNIYKLQNNDTDGSFYIKQNETIIFQINQSGDVIITNDLTVGTNSITIDGNNENLCDSTGCYNLSTLNASTPETSPAGSDGQIQFNDGGAFGADSYLTYNTTSNSLNHGILGDSNSGNANFYGSYFGALNTFMIFDSGNGAFRGGLKSSGTGSSGLGSFNWGYNTDSSGILSAGILGGGSADNSVAIGRDSVMQGSNVVAIGKDATVETGNGGVSVGSDSRVNNSFSLALGSSTETTGIYSTSVGYFTKTHSDSSITFGTTELATPITNNKDYTILFGLHRTAGGIQNLLELEYNKGARFGATSGETNTMSGGDDVYIVDNLEVGGSLATGTNTYDGLSNGDINASTIYYDTLTAKSPTFLCEQDTNWCQITVPQYQESLYVDFDDTWQIEEVVFKETSYTPNEFLNTVCPTNANTQAICDEIITKYQKLKAKRDAEIAYNTFTNTCINNGFTVKENNCIETVETITDYAGAVESYQKPIYNYTTTTIYELNNDLQVIEQEIQERDQIIDYQTKYRFIDGCSWKENTNHYYCVEEIVRYSYS